MTTDNGLRRHPYPYRAALAICSDLDETPDASVYFEIARFLNTTQMTSMGPGVGLEVGNTLYFDMPANQYAYHTTDDRGRRMARSLIESGHIDCLHSYGDYATSREHVIRALDDLSGLSRRIEVWVDHAIAPSNFGADIMRGRGDLPGSDIYHADLTCNHGIKYVWRGRVTSVIGQDVPHSLTGIFDRRHFLDSSRTVAKEALKGIMARCGSVKYSMHAPNHTLRAARLRDGRGVFEFLRCNPFWGGVQDAATADGIADALSPTVIDTLIRRSGTCILYTHLGKVRNPREPFEARTRDALRTIADRHQRGDLLVTTTRRLLGYRRALAEIGVHVKTEGQETIIDLRRQPGPIPRMEPVSVDDLDGLTFYVDRPDRVRLRIDGTEVSNRRVNTADETGRRSVSIGWRRLEFPDL